MRVIRSPRLMQEETVRLRRAGRSIGFVPTMGALHEGHASLIRTARKENNVAIVSIFVNPAQFAPSEDLKQYPRPFAKDVRLCRKHGVDLVFAPQPSSIYPRDFKTAVSVKDLSAVLCGKSRPGHFTGVATVVAKLFNIIQPDRAYFGQKDAQQAIIIRRMAEDLNFPVKVRVLPTVRQADGLALSSRNAYLNARQRAQCPVLYQSLRLAKALIKKGVRDAATIINAVTALIRTAKDARIDYAVVVDPKDLTPLTRIKGRCLISLAVRFGKTRLIDNIVV